MLLEVKVKVKVKEETSRSTSSRRFQSAAPNIPSPSAMASARRGDGREDDVPSRYNYDE